MPSKAPSLAVQSGKITTTREGTMSHVYDADTLADLLTQHLGQLMSETSEGCYSAGWLTRTEDAVPHLCLCALATGEPQDWGFGAIDPEQAAEMVEIAAVLGHWADYCMSTPCRLGDRYIPYSPEVPE